MAASLVIAASASFGFRRSSASNAWPKSCSARPPICTTLRSSCASSDSYDLTICSFMGAHPSPQNVGSAEPARDVVLRTFVRRIGEHVVCRALFDQDAQMEERRALRHARRLLHRVGHDDDGEVLLQLFHKLL